MQHTLTVTSPRKAIPLPPVLAPPLISSHVTHPVPRTHNIPDQTLCQSDACKEAISDGSCTAAADMSSTIKEVSTAEPLMKLPGLVSRPFTLQQAVAEAITEAAYKQGSNDNLATVVVDLVGSRRYAIDLSAQNGSNSPAEEHIVGIAVSLEQQGLGDAIIPVPRRSTSPVACSLIDTKGTQLPLLC